MSDESWLAAFLEVEAALARAEASVGLVPAEHAEAIAAACRARAFDLDALGAASAPSGNPILPLVAALRAALPSEAAAAVHFGATSQDVLDTAAMLVARRAIEAILEDVEAAADVAAGLARGHRDTLMVGRTLLQQALPTTFGAKAATWLSGLDAAAERLIRVREERLALQLGGAVGTLAALGADGPAVVRELARELDLLAPILPWHAERTRVADIAGALGTAAVAIDKPALDIVLLAQTEVAELSDSVPGRGGSSTLPQKRNPVAAIEARACAAQAPGLVATLLAVAGSGEHERAAGAWHAEWRPLTELCRAVGSAAAWLRDALEHVTVDPDRMRAAVDAAGGRLLAERVVLALSPRLGRSAAEHEVAAVLAEEARSGVPFGQLLTTRDAVRAALPEAELAQLPALLDPATYLGSAGDFVDAACRAHARRREGRP